MIVSGIIIRSADPDLDLEVQAGNLLPEAYEAMQRVATVDLKAGIRLHAVSDSAHVNLGTPTDPNFISLWQLSLFAALFEAEGEPIGEPGESSVEVDHEARRYSVAAVRNNIETKEQN